MRIDKNKIYKSNNCGEFRVVNYNGCMSVEVEFLATGTRKITQATHIALGCVKDKMHPSVFGIGFVGYGKHSARENLKQSKAYSVWSGMLERCYCPKSLALHKTYAGCVVADEWHNFQNFAEWFEKNYIEGYHLDKDIKSTGDKVYSAETCIFVSRCENNEKAQAKYYTFISPKGEIVNIYNLAKFCRENNLNGSAMCAVSTGRYSQYKGWTVHE